jgi:hypothetical protein
LSRAEKVAFLRRAFNKIRTAQNNDNVEVLCPNKKCKSHNSIKLKLVIHLGTQQYNCWVCGISGAGVGRLVSKFRNALVGEANKVFKNFTTDDKLNHVKQEIYLELPKGFKLLAEAENCIDPDIKAAINYAKSRGMSRRDFWYFKLGAVTSGGLRRRVIMPSFDDQGDLNYYVARSTLNNIKMKYINSKVPKKEVIFNGINIDWKDELTLVEGPFDLVKANDNATCLLGCTLKEDQVLFKKIVKNNTPVCLALDPDVIDKSYNIARLLTSYGINVRILDCTGYEDVGEMSKADFCHRLIEAKPFGNDDRLLSLISSIKSGSIV